MDSKTMVVDFISVDDGRERVPVKNKNGDEVGAFYFCPTDMGILARYNKVAAEFEKVVEPLENAGEDAGQDAFADALEEARARLFAAVDGLFGDGAGVALFGQVHPFSPVNGAFYCENVLNAVGKFIGARFDVETKKISKRVTAYTKAYAGKKA